MILLGVFFFLCGSKFFFFWYCSIRTRYSRLSTKSDNISKMLADSIIVFCCLRSLAHTICIGDYFRLRNLENSHHTTGCTCKVQLKLSLGTCAHKIQTHGQRNNLGCTVAPCSRCNQLHIENSQKPCFLSYAVETSMS